jgi:hypothetical protein
VARVFIPPVDIAVKIARAMDVTVEYLVTGQENKKQKKLFDHNIRSIQQLLVELGEKDIETTLGLARILKSQIKPVKTDGDKSKKTKKFIGKDSHGK